MSSRRGDLARLLLKGERTAREGAVSLGFIPPEIDDSWSASRGQGGGGTAQPSVDDGTLESQAPDNAIIGPMAFWRAESWEPRGTAFSPERPATKEQDSVAAALGASGRSILKTPSPPLIAPWSDLEPRLLAALSQDSTGRELDVDAVVHALSRGQALRHLPRRNRKVWPSRLSLWDDRSTRLITMLPDQWMVTEQLVALCGDDAIEHRILSPWLPGSALLQGSTEAVVLVLGDLGWFGSAALRAAWAETGQELRRRGVLPVALSPIGPEGYSPDMRAVWSIVPWVGGGLRVALSEGERAVRAERLLRLASPAALLQPGLLRAMQMLLPDEEADLLTELDALQHAVVQGFDASAVLLFPAEHRRLREEFAAMDAAYHSTVSDLLRRWRADMPIELLWAEALAWDVHLKEHHPADMENVTAFARWVREAVSGTGELESPIRWARYGRALLSGLHRAILSDDSRPYAEDLRVIFSHAYEGMRIDDIPEGVDMNRRPASDDAPVRWWCVLQEVDGLIFKPEKTRLEAGAQSEPGSPVARLQASTVVTVMTRTGRSQALLTDSLRPALEDAPVILETPQGAVCLAPWHRHWPVAAGRDEHGLYAGEKVSELRPRFRWIPPGHFLMGSPDDEKERFEWEGPQHRVELTGGFWLGSTPVTQALWSSVMPSNPSRFKGDEHPVEGVSWYDAVRFCNLLSAKLGLEAAYEVGDGDRPTVRLIETSWGFRLPTEAEWEYACRAGTTTRFWSGDSEDDFRRVEWSADNAQDGTQPVATKPANPWGLHDMHGNVYEWCFDGWELGTPYTSEARTNPVSHAGSSRVIRGGSWVDAARFARAAFRFGSVPLGRRDSLGFRLARGPVQVRGASGVGGAPRPRVPEARRDAGGLLVVPVRDEHGTGFQFGAGGIEHLLRRIAPGEFLMGSPGDEEGRWDDEGPQHMVRLTLGFQLGNTPVTQALWSSVMPSNPSRFKGEDHPVEGVSWYEAVGFCNALSAKLGLEAAYEIGEGDEPEVRLIETSWGFRLPTEAEWEYACRAGTTTRFWSGDSEDDLRRVGWFSDNAERSTQPVAQKPANPWGLHDMHGNVYEWCFDGLDFGTPYTSEARTNPVSHAGSSRVLRGGSWRGSARLARAACRGGDGPLHRLVYLGFRLARGPVQAHGVRNPADTSASRGAVSDGDRTEQATGDLGETS